MFRNQQWRSLGVKMWKVRDGYFRIRICGSTTFSFLIKSCHTIKFRSRTHFRFDHLFLSTIRVCGETYATYMSVCGTAAKAHISCVLVDKGAILSVSPTSSLCALKAVFVKQRPPWCLLRFLFALFFPGALSSTSQSFKCIICVFSTPRVKIGASSDTVFYCSLFD